MRPVLVAALLAVGVGCAAPPPPGQPRSAADELVVSAAPEPAPLAAPPLDALEREVARRLRAHASALAQIGPRNVTRPWEMASAADYLAGEFEGLGYPVERQGFDVDGSAFMNLGVTAFGGEEKDVVVLVGAHYDTDAAGGGSGAALAVLELARLFARAQTTRSIRFELFALGAAAGSGPEASGAFVFMKTEAARAAHARALSDSDRDMRARGELPETTPPLEVDTSELTLGILLDQLDGFGAPPRVSVARAHLPRQSSSSPDPESALSTHLSGAPFGNIELVTPGSTSDATHVAEAGLPAYVVSGFGSGPVDVDLLARVVVRLAGALGELCGQRTQLDGLFLQDPGN